MNSRAFTIGTAGHVDHGKSTLVRALTGIDPDRLAEEKARQMTIELGFAWFTLPSGREVSVVDVPGHERFVKTMLAGAHGLDAAMLVVAADEGPMPQTDEHLAILDLLQIEHGLVVLTKRDTVDADWLDLVAEEMRERITGSVLAGAPIVRVSAHTGEGLDDLRRELDRLLQAAPEKPTGLRPRLPIDRIFTMSGFGTVVTGTLSGGELRVGQEIRIEPHGVSSRIRGLQTHQHKVEHVSAGARVAVNLTGVAVSDLHRGDVLTISGVLSPSQRVDVRFRLLSTAPVVIEQNAEVDFFSGATELPGRLTLLDRDTISPGDDAWVQIRFRTPVAVLKGDRFILRRPSPSVTIGGGEIIDAAPPRHKRFRPDVLDALATLAQGSPDEIVLQTLEAGPREVRSLRGGTLAGLDDAVLDAALEQLVAEGDVRLLTSRDGATGTNIRPGDFVIAALAWNNLRDRIVTALDQFHINQPLRRGLSREELKRRLGITPPRLFDEIMAAAARDDTLIDDGATLRRPAFAIELDSVRREMADRYLAALAAHPFAPPSPVDFGLDGETVGALEDRGELVQVADNVVYHPDAYQQVIVGTLALIDTHGAFTLAQFRDHFGTSRKYAQATLEHFDQIKLTRRSGDERVRGSAAKKDSAS